MNEIRTRYTTDKDIYAVLIRATDGYVYAATGFELPVTANWADYAIPLTEQDTTGLYYATMPTVPAGIHDVLLFLQAGNDPLTTDAQVGQGSIDWAGTVEATVASRSTYAGGAVILAADALDNVMIEDDLNVRQAISLMSAVLGGVISGADTDTMLISAAGWPDLVRVTATVDAVGNRTTLVFDLPT